MRLFSLRSQAGFRAGRAGRSPIAVARRAPGPSSEPRRRAGWRGPGTRSRRSRHSAGADSEARGGARFRPQGGRRSTARARSGLRGGRNRRLRRDQGCRSHYGGERPGRPPPAGSANQTPAAPGDPLLHEHQAARRANHLGDRDGGVTLRTARLAAHASSLIADARARYAADHRELRVVIGVEEERLASPCGVTA